MIKKIAVLKGDGIGPEVTNQSLKVLEGIAEKFNHKFEYSEGLIGAVAIDKTGNPLPADTIDICLDSDAILFGAIGHPKYDNDPSAKVRPEQGLLGLRKALQLFANIYSFHLVKLLRKVWFSSFHFLMLDLNLPKL